MSEMGFEEHFNIMKDKVSAQELALGPMHRLTNLDDACVGRD